MFSLFEKKLRAEKKAPPVCGQAKKEAPRNSSKSPWFVVGVLGSFWLPF